MAGQTERLQELRDRLTTSQADADELGLELVSYLIAMALTELDTEARRM